MSRILQYARVSAMLILLVAVLLSTAFSQDFQSAPVVLSAPDVLPKEILTGPNYTVRDRVVSDGLVNIYELDTVYGPLKVESTALLLKRINELRAIARIEKLKGSDAYIDAAKKAGLAPLKTAEGLVTDPAATVSGIASGVGRFFTSVSDAVTNKDPYQPGAGKSMLGQAAYKRQFAYEHGVNPYSDFAPLQKALDDLAWTAAAGGLTVKAAMMAIPGAAGTIVGLGGTADSLKALVSEKTPAELARINGAKLAEMGVPDPVVQDFLHNAAYDPYERTLLVGALANMKEVQARDIYVERAAAANDPVVTLFLRVRAQLMEVYHEKEGMLSRFVDAGGTPLVVTREGRAVGVFPFDYIAWTAELAKREESLSAAIGSMQSVTGKEMWITGKVSANARKALEKKGWKIEDNIQDRFLRKVNY